MPALTNLVDAGFRSTVHEVQVGRNEILQKLESTGQQVKQTLNAVNDFFSGRVPIMISPQKNMNSQESTRENSPTPFPAASSSAAALLADEVANVNLSMPDFKMSRTIVSVVDLHREYVEGLGGNPAVKDMERQYGTKWRLSTADRKFFNRRKVIYDEIERIASNQRLAPSEAAKILEEHRLALKFKSLDALMKEIKKKPRE